MRDILGFVSIFGRSEFPSRGAGQAKSSIAIPRIAPVRLAALLAAGLAGGALAASDASAQFFVTASSATYETGDEPRIDPGENAFISHTIWGNGSETLTDLTFTVDYGAVLAGARLDLGSISTFNCGTPEVSSNGLGLVSVSSVDPVGQCLIRYSVSIPASTPASSASNTYVASPSNITGTGSTSGAIDRDWDDFNIEVGLDTAAPSPVITGPGGPVDAPFNIDISFLEFGLYSETIDGFAVSDLVVANATVAFADLGGDAAQTGDGVSSVTIEVTPTGAGTPITVQLPAATVVDQSGNDNTASSVYSVVYDVDGDPRDDVDFTAVFVANPVDPLDQATLRFTITNNSADDLTAGQFDLDIDASSSTDFVGVAPAALPCGASSTATLFSANTFVRFSSMELLSGGSCSFDLPIEIDDALAAGNYGFSTTALNYNLGVDSYTDTQAADVLTVDFAEGAGGTIQFTKTFADDEVAPGDTIDVEFFIAATGAFTTTGIAFTDDLDAMLSSATATGTPLSDVCGAGSSLTGTSVLSLTGGNLASEGSCTFTVTLSVPAGAADGTYTNTTGNLTATRSDDGAVTIDPASDSFDVNVPGGTPPSVTISGDTDDLGVAFSRDIAVRFSEPITDLVAGDFALTNATSDGLSGSGSDWTLTVSPVGTGAVAVFLPAAVVQDAEGDDNALSNTFTFDAVAGDPEIDIEGNSVSIVDGDVSPSLADHTQFVPTDVTAGTSSRTFTIENLGTDTLTITNVALSGANMADFSITSAPAASVTPGATTTFTIGFDPSVAASRAATVTVTSDDADEASYDFAIAGVGTVLPEIRVAGAGNTINIAYADASPSVADGTDFGSLAADSGAASATFTINNDGGAALTLGSEAVSISGSNDFSVTAQPATTVAAGDSTTFTILFDPAIAGASNATVSIANDDGDEAPFLFGIMGVGTDNIAPSGHTVAFDAALYGASNYAAASFTIDDPETLTNYSYTISSDGGGANVTGTGNIPIPAAGDPSEFQVSGVDVSGLNEGTLTVSVVLTDASGNAATAVTNTVALDLTGPTPSISTGSSDPVSGAFSLTVDFGEAVTGFLVGDISVGNGALSAFSDNGGGDFSATVTPSADGSVTVDVGSGVAQDAAGNDNVAATQFVIENDETPPTVALSTGSADPVSGAFAITATFSEGVNGFGLGDFSVGNGAASNFAATSATVYTATITPAADGTVTVDISGAVAQDDAGNNNAAATQFSIENDETVPTVALTSGAADPIAGTFTITATFSEDVTSFAAGDFAVGNGAVSNFSATSATVYTATITPAADGTVTVDVAGGAAQDSAGNDSTAATQFSIENDETVPTVVLTTGSVDPVSGAFTITATFSEGVNGFGLGDFSVGNGGASNFAAMSVTVYTATITPASDGSVTVDVGANAAQDGAGNGNAAATQFSIENDETLPTVALSTGSADPVSGTFTITATFSESVTGFAVGDFSVGNGSASDFAATSATVYTATITPAADGTVTVDVAGAVAQDAAGNDNSAATQFSIENDETLSTVTLTTGSSDPVSGAFTITATFSEAVTGFAVDDFAVGNGSVSNFLATSTTVYTATITPATDGTVTVDVAAGAAHDGAGNGNAAASQFSIENDETGPAVVLTTGSADPVSGAFTITATFSESVTGFGLGDLSVGNGAASNFSATSATAYTATITPAGDGSVTIDVAAGAAQDSAGNASLAATQFTIENDETAPTVALSTGSADPVSGAFTITATFSENVTGLVLADFGVGNGTASDFSATSATVYTATITPAADGTVTVDVAGAVAQDAAGNNNTAAPQFSIDNDETVPTVALTTGSSDPVSGAFAITATFSEAVTGFAVDDLSVGNGSASNFSATSTTVYTATITPTIDGTVTVDVAGGAAQDSAGNDSTAATQFSIENDETGPAVVLTTGSAEPVSGAFIITATFSEAVTGLALGDFSVGNGAASSFSAISANVYTATITPVADGTVTVNVAGNAAQDGAGNGNVAAAQFSIENDETAPMVSLAGPAIDQVGTFTVSVDFSEDVTGLVLADFTVGNGSAANLAGSGNSYTVDVTPATSGSVTVNLAANSVQDAAGNANVAATQFAVDADLSLPGLDSLAVSDADLRVEDVGRSFTLTATFSEAMDPGQAPVFTFSTDLSATLSLDSGAFSAGDTVYTATYSVTDGGQVAADVDVTVSAAADAAGNALPDSPVADLLSVEMRRGSLFVAVAITGATDGSFDFSGDLGDFSVATVSQAGVTSFNDLVEGSYTFTAAAVDGFNLDAIGCTGGTSVLDSATGSATVTLGPTDSVTCEFTQIAEPDVDETVIPDVTIELPTLTDDPTSATSSFDLQNVGGEAFYFTASTDQPWLVIDPTSGSIPATGSLEFTVSFTAAVLDLAPGSYTATITVVEVSPPSQRGGGRKANALETLEIPVNIAIEPRLGDLTIITRTTAPEEGEGSFSYTSTLTALDGQTVLTAGGSASTTVNDVLRGSYVLTQLASEGWDLASLSCTGDLDGGNIYDLASGQVTIDLDAEENMVCTFANRRNEDYIRGVTLSAIRNFMATRADLILTNSPRLAGRMRSDRSSATPNSFAADFRDGRLNAQMSTSLGALRQAAEASQPQQPGAERFSLNGRTGLSSLDVWMQASVASVSDNRAGLGSDADFSIVHVGTDIMVSANVLAGVLLQYDQTDMTTGDWNSAVEGNGWMAGPYMVARISDRTYLDLRAAWGRSDNSVNPIGTYTDSFETDRWLIEANLAGDILHGGWRVTPGVGLAYFHESQDSYTDTLGIFIPGQTITIGRLSAGPEVAYRFENAAGGYVEPYLNVTALYDYDDADVFNAAGTLQTLGHLRGDARLGLTVEMANGGRISGEVSMIGLGEGDFEANNAMIRIRLPLSMH
jgi:hypothetical protein